MKVKEDIVYDRVTGNVIGFCNLGTVYELLLAKRDTNSHPPAAVWFAVF